ncbi:uncharacterized protein METZ01_LOCUS387461, partial [marine metagenome]
MSAPDNPFFGTIQRVIAINTLFGLFYSPIFFI